MSRLRSSTALACPVCRARFRRTRTCSRCGADLTPLMQLVVRAHRLRERAAAELGRGRLVAALACSRRAQALHATPFGARQQGLMLLLVQCSLPEAPPDVGYASPRA